MPLRLDPSSIGVFLELKPRWERRWNKPYLHRRYGSVGDGHVGTRDAKSRRNAHWEAKGTRRGRSRGRRTLVRCEKAGLRLPGRGSRRLERTATHETHPRAHETDQERKEETCEDRKAEDQLRVQVPNEVRRRRRKLAGTAAHGEGIGNETDRRTASNGTCKTRNKLCLEAGQRRGGHEDKRWERTAWTSIEGVSRQGQQVLFHCRGHRRSQERKQVRNCTAAQ